MADSEKLQPEESDINEPVEEEVSGGESSIVGEAATAAAAAAQEGLISTEEAKTFLDIMARQQDPQNIEIVKELVAAMSLAKKDSAGSKEDEDRKGNHKFWSTQPVMDYDEDDTNKNEAIEPDKKPEEIRQTPFALPAGYEWTEIDVLVEGELKELYELLSFNYVEDGDNMFRFDYSAKFLEWALQPPGWLKSWHVGVRVSSNKKLVGFISAVPADIRIYDHHQKMVEINYLCVHKKLRTKRLAPVLIKEITRRVHLQNIFQATYTAGIRLPRPVSACQYYHRNLNPKKLIETGFSHLPRNSTLAALIKKYKLPENTLTPGLRPLQAKDVKDVATLLSTKLSLYSFAPILSAEEVAHYLVPRDGVVYSYVVEDPATHIITDFVSFYSLPSSIIRHPVHKRLNAAYLYYYAVSKTPLSALINDALILAKQNDFDVFNCLKLMDNHVFLEELLFGAGDGTLQFYLYNWATRKVEHDKCGLVLL